MMAGRIVEVYMEVKRETDRAYLVSDGVVECWLPKSQVELEEDCGPGDYTTFTVPEWLAKDKELI